MIITETIFTKKTSDRTYFTNLIQIILLNYFCFEIVPVKVHCWNNICECLYNLYILDLHYEIQPK